MRIKPTNRGSWRSLMSTVGSWSALTSNRWSSRGIGPAPERSFYDFKPLRRERPGTTVKPIRCWRKFAFRAPRRTSLWFKDSSSSLMLSVAALSIGCCAVCYGGVVESVNGDTTREPRWNHFFHPRSERCKPLGRPRSWRIVCLRHRSLHRSATIKPGLSNPDRCFFSDG